MTAAAARCFLAALILCACSPAYSVVLETPGFDGVQTTRMQGNVLESGALGASDTELNLQRVVLGPDTIYRVELRYMGDGLPIDAVAPLELLLDGDTLRLARDSIASQVVYDAVRVERTLYQASDSVLSRLAVATSIVVRFRLGAWLEERRLGTTALDRVRGFVREHVSAEQ